MSEKPVHLTKEQTHTISQYFENQDRGRGYLELHLHTGFPAAFDMAQISQFSGSLGGIARGANEQAAKNSAYPAEGVIHFSEQIANAQSNYIKTQYENGGGITNEGLLNVAKSAWEHYKIGNHFPGNPVLASQHIEGTIDDFFSSGTMHTLRSIPDAFSGSKLEDFTVGANANNYEVHYMPDFSVRYVTEKMENGKTVYSEMTGSTFNEKTGKHEYIYTTSIPIDKAELAKKLGVSAEQIIVEANSLTDKSGILDYRIIHEKGQSTSGSKFSQKPAEEEHFTAAGAKKTNAKKFSETEKENTKTKPSQSSEQTKPTNDDHAQKIEDTKKILASTTIIAEQAKIIGDCNGNANIQKAATVLGSAAAAGTSYIAFGAATGLAAAVPAAALATALIAIGSVLFSSNKGDKSMQEIHKSLGIIFDEVRSMRQENNMHFNQLHKEVFMVYELAYSHYVASENHYHSLYGLGEFTVKELSNLINTFGFSETNNIIKHINIGELPDTPAQFKANLGSLEDIALTLSTEEAFNGANLKIQEIHEDLLQNQIALRGSSVDNIAFFIDYAKKELKITDIEDGENYPNFNLYYKYTDAFVKLVNQAIAHDNVVTNSSEKLITPSYLEYIKRALTRFEEGNKDITNLISQFKEQNVVDKMASKYVDKLGELSELITTNNKEYSNALSVEGMKEGNSIFSPDFEIIYHFVSSYHVDPLDGNGNWRCNQYFHSLNGKLQYNSPHKTHAHKRVSHMTGAEIKQLCEPHLPFSYDHIKNGVIKEQVSNFLHDKRGHFFNSLKDKSEYGVKLKEISHYEQLIKIYAYFLGDNTNLNLQEAIANHPELLKKIPATEVVSAAFNLGTEMPALITLKDNFLKIQTSPANFTAPYEKAAANLKWEIDYTSKLIEVLQTMQNYNEEVKPNHGDEPKKQQETADKPNHKPAEAVDKAYMELKYIFQKVLNQYDDIKKAFEYIPDKLNTFNQLMENVHIEETNTINPVPEGFTFEDLKLYQCDVQCLDSYLQRHDEGYRASTKHDQSMDYVLEVINEFSDEIHTCHC